MERSLLKVPVTPAAIGAFLCLLGVLYQTHELGHHFFGGIVCGRLGAISLSTYTSAEGCLRLPDLLTELFGPLISLMIAYAAAARLRAKPSLAAFGCIFASYFHLRWIPPLLGGGDELDVMRKLGHDSGFIVAVALFMLGLPPVIVAWRAVLSSGRAVRIGLAYALPLPFLWYVDALAAGVSGSQAILPGLERIQVLHVPLLILILDIALVFGFAALGRRARRSCANDAGRQFSG
jgi:hypothetical protein